MSVPTAPRRTGWVGWIYFAGVVMIITGALNIISGIFAIARPNVAVFTQDQALLFSIGGWGWLHLILGIVILGSGIGVFSGNGFARTIGVIGASLSLIANFVFLPTTPWWSLVIITLDVLVIYALIAHGNELKD